MTSLSIRYTATRDYFSHRPLNKHDWPGRVSKPNYLSFKTFALKSRICAAAAAAAAVGATDHMVFRSGFESNVDLVSVEETSQNMSNDRFDEWMRKSVTEIVKNIKQAPLLVKVYADGVVKTEKAVEAADWPEVVRESPEGVILVEELRDGGEGEEEEEDGTEGTKEFGVLIQGKGKGRDNRCKSACYLLKTSSVNGGMGAFCTHFCLMKVRSFSQSGSSQLNECWLLQ